MEKAKIFSVKSFLGFLFLCHPTNDSCALCVFWDIPLQALSEENKTFFNVRNMNISSHNEFKYHDFRISALQQAFTHTSWNTNPPQMSSITHSPEIRISNIILINTKIFSTWSQNLFISPHLLYFYISLSPPKRVCLQTKAKQWENHKSKAK